MLKHHQYKIIGDCNETTHEKTICTNKKRGAYHSYTHCGTTSVP